jgi:hypothetical protein
MTDKIVDISNTRETRDRDSDEPRHLVTVGGLIDETVVSLCIYGDDLVPEKVSEALGVIPAHAHRKGELMKSRSPHAPRTVAYKTGVWIFKLTGQAPQEPEDVTLALLDQLPDDESVWTDLSARYHVRLKYGLFVEAWNRGFDLSPTLMARIAQMRAEVGFDIYADLEGDEGQVEG